MDSCKWYHCSEPRAGRSWFCSRSCKNKFSVTKRRIKLRIMAVEYLGGSCEACGFTGPADAFDFHHKDPSEKTFGISGSGVTRAWAKVQDELDKCKLLCARCHRLEHWETKASRDIETEVLQELAEAQGVEPCSAD